MQTLNKLAFNRWKDKVIPATFASLVLGAIYIFTSHFPVGPITWLSQLPAAIIVAITSLARLNDIKPEQNDWHWHLRRAGFILAGTAAVAFITCPFTTPIVWPTWKGVILEWGVALAWLTTPSMPPWSKYITGNFRNKDKIKP